MMKKALAVLINILLTQIAILANPADKKELTRNEYIDKYKAVAIEEMHQSGVPASITLAQGCLESANGNSRLARKANNHFGIKCKGNWTGKKAYEHDDRRNECFRKYKNVLESYTDHSNFLKNGQRYQFLFELDPTNYQGWAKGLSKAGYATDRKYADRLIKIIEDHQLYKYDFVSTRENRILAKAKNKKAKRVGTVSLYHNRKVSKINNTQGIIARKGDTYSRIAQEVGIKEWEILKYNEAQKGDAPNPGDFVYLNMKRAKAARGNDFHKVEQGETMRDIAQKYGIRLNRLYRLNRMDKGKNATTGTSIHLRKRKAK